MICRASSCGMKKKRNKKDPILFNVSGYRVDTPLNNELSLSHRNYDSGDEYARLKARQGPLGSLGSQQEQTPSLHSDTGSRRDPMRGKSDSAERRHAEIVRTAANKSFPDAGPVNVMETNPQASWKRDKVALSALM